MLFLNIDYWVLYHTVLSGRRMSTNQHLLFCGIIISLGSTFCLVVYHVALTLMLLKTPCL